MITWAYYLSLLRLFGILVANQACKKCSESYKLFQSSVSKVVHFWKQKSKMRSYKLHSKSVENSNHLNNWFLLQWLLLLSWRWYFYQQTYKRDDNWFSVPLSREESDETDVSLDLFCFSLRIVRSPEGFEYLWSWGLLLWRYGSSKKFNFSDSKMALFNSEFQSCLSDTFEYCSDIAYELHHWVGSYSNVVNLLCTLICFDYVVQIFSHKARNFS